MSPGPAIWFHGHMVDIVPADLGDLGLTSFLQEHLDDMAPTAPPESRHALDLEALQRPDVRLWTALDGRTTIGTVALVEIEPGHDELKSMRTAPSRRGEGIARQLLAHALEDARSRVVTRISLETGSMEFFAPARGVYRRAGFRECPPFGSYVEDPHSVFLTYDLSRHEPSAASSVRS